MTSGQKYDVTIVFPDPDFLKDAGISVIREYLRQILRFLFFCICFQDLWVNKGEF